MNRPNISPLMKGRHRGVGFTGFIYICRHTTCKKYFLDSLIPLVSFDNAIILIRKCVMQEIKINQNLIMAVIKNAAVVLIVILLAGCGGKEKDYIDRMAMEHSNDSPVGNASSGIDQTGEVSGEEVVYANVRGEEVTGYLARPEDAIGNEPGIIVIHEWWGLNENIRMMTDKLAGEGYSALAVDLYNGKVAETSDSAGDYAGSVEINRALSNLTQAYNYLLNEYGAENIGTIGWCFGGGWSLRIALAHPEDIDATVIYYGRLVTDKEELEKLEMPILGVFGAEDQGIPVQDVREFEKALTSLDKDADVHIYEGAGHAFANPSGERYQKDAAEDAWAKTVSFLEENLKQ